MRHRIALMAILLLFSYGCAKEQDVGLQFRIAETEPGEGLTEMTLAGTDERFYLHDEVLMTNVDVDTAFVAMWSERPSVEVVFNEAGREKFARITRENLGRRMGMVVDGRLVTAPTIRAEIRMGKAVINGDFSQEEAQRIAEGVIGK